MAKNQRHELAVTTNGVLNMGEWAGKTIAVVPLEYLEFLLTTGLLTGMEETDILEEIRLREELS